MNYNFNKKHIYSTNFDSFKNIITHDEFYGETGTEHYRLLSYISTLFNNVDILDIGTNYGYSALALSYNKTNTIHTFDTEKKDIKEDIKNKNNIKFHIENLFEVSVQDKWKDTILKCPFILLDVEPHNGFMEINFYNYLKNINYQGFIICDDIWYFKEMRDNFWYKIPYTERYDLTHLGHWSGTGIITFNKQITFPKNDNNNWTLVTAYFNLTKCFDASNQIKERDAKYYFEHSVSTLSLPYNLVIYCDNENLEIIKKIRPEYLASKTYYIICNFDDLKFKKNGFLLNEKFSDYRQKIISNRQKNIYDFDPRNTASYYLFCMSRYIMLKDVIKLNIFSSTHFCWINFCIERMGYKNLIHLDEALSIKRNKFSTCYIDYISPDIINNITEYFKWGRCSMCSGFFTGNAHYMYKVCDLIENKFLEYLGKGYGHADEQLYSPVYFENIDLFEHYYGDYREMITNYVYIYDKPEPPIYNFIQASFNAQNYEKCLEACKFVFKSYCLNKCPMLSQDYLKLLYIYYMDCKRNLFINKNKLLMD